MPAGARTYPLKKLTIPVTVKLIDGGAGIEANGSVRFKGGSIKNKDELLLHVHPVGTAS